MGRHKFFHESSAGLTPKPKEGSSDKGSGLTPDSWWVIQTKKEKVRGEVSPLGLKDCRVCRAYELWRTCEHTGIANVAGEMVAGAEFFAAFAVVDGSGALVGTLVLQTWQWNLPRDASGNDLLGFCSRCGAATRAGAKMALSVPAAVKFSGLKSILNGKMTAGMGFCESQEHFEG